MEGTHVSKGTDETALVSILTPIITPKSTLARETCFWEGHGEHPLACSTDTAAQNLSWAMVPALWRCDEHVPRDLARRTVRCLAASSPLSSERNVSGDVIWKGPSNSDVVTYSFFLPFRHH